MKEILIVRFSSLGDIVLLTGVLKYVKENMQVLWKEMVERNE